MCRSASITEGVLGAHYLCQERHSRPLMMLGLSRVTAAFVSPKGGSVLERVSPKATLAPTARRYEEKKGKVYILSILVNTIEANVVFVS